MSMPFENFNSTRMSDSAVSLGLFFDKKLTFNQHVTYLKDRCIKALISYELSLTRIGERIVTTAQVVRYSYQFEFGLWLYFVQFCSAISP